MLHPPKFHPLLLSSLELRSYTIKYAGIFYYKYHTKNTSIQSGQCEPVRLLPFFIHVPGWMQCGRGTIFHEYACQLQRMLHWVCRHMSDNQIARQTAITRKSRQWVFGCLICSSCATQLQQVWSWDGYVLIRSKGGRLWMVKEETSKLDSDGKICVSPPIANYSFAFLSTNQSLFIKVISPPSPTHRVKGER